MHAPAQAANWWSYSVVVSSSPTHTTVSSQLQEAGQGGSRPSSQPAGINIMRNATRGVRAYAEPLYRHIIGVDTSKGTSYILIHSLHEDPFTLLSPSTFMQSHLQQRATWIQVAAPVTIYIQP